VADSADIDRLIEEGLSRYGAGDLDTALLIWEEVLKLDPDNAQATSYVEYVRSNYDLLMTGEPSLEDDGSGFPIGEEPEYQIEITEGRDSLQTLPLAASTIALGNVDAGWELDDELPAGRDVSFDDATREYQGVTRRPVDPDSGPTDFASEEYTGGFTQETNIRKRDLGFVQPTEPEPERESETVTVAVKKSPDPEPEPDVHEAQTVSLQSRADSGDYELELIESLPTPRPAEESGEILLPKSTRDLPTDARPPARPDPSDHSQAEVMLAHAPTRDLVSHAQDLAAAHAPTRELPGEARKPHPVDSLVSAPTRDLGLRPGGRAPTSEPGLGDDDMDMPTRQSDARAIREAAFISESPTIEKPRANTQETRHDIVLPFDPIAAQSAQILDDVDAGAPSGESAEDKTRRRISRLLELAGDWSETGELDKAVSAVDLALAEDPNSALGQKLITRNKDRIMGLMQAFIGDLERTPQLARPLHELASAPISPRAAFLLSRIDGTMTVDELLDVSGMPRLEAYRHLCQLILRGILR